MANLKRHLGIILLMIYPVAALAQDSAVSKLFSRPNRGTETITINVPTESIPKPLEVTNDTVVTIKVKKKPNMTCVVATKREELKPEPNPIAQMLKIITGFGSFGLGTFFKGGDKNVTSLSDDKVSADMLCPPPTVPVVPTDKEADQVEGSIANIRKSLFRSVKGTDSVKGIDSFREQYRGTTERISKLTSCKGNICKDAKSFNNEKDELKKEIEELLAVPLPVLESTDLQIASLKKVLSDRYKTLGGPNEENWINNVNERLDCLVSTLDYIKHLREALVALRVEFEKFHNLLEAYPTITDLAKAQQAYFEFPKQLPADENAKVMGTVTCTNFFTKQPVGEQVPFTVTYQNLPRAMVSVGILISSLNKRQVGTQPLRTGTAADGTPTFRVAFAETDKSEIQVVPFSFFNYYLSGTRKLNLNLTGGIGLNPNNGSNQVEFFVGGALGFKNVYLQVGGHIGRWQELGGGFLIGETVPDKFPAVPIERRYSMKPAIGISYRLPLP